jgi:hypothetical protein
MIWDHQSAWLILHNKTTKRTERNFAFRITGRYQKKLPNECVYVIETTTLLQPDPTMT